MVAACLVLQHHHTSLRPVMKLILFLPWQITTRGNTLGNYFKEGRIHILKETSYKTVLQCHCRVKLKAECNVRILHTTLLHTVYNTSFLLQPQLFSTINCQINWKILQIPCMTSNQVMFDAILIMNHSTTVLVVVTDEPGRDRTGRTAGC